MAETMVTIWQVCVAIAFVSPRKAVVTSVESYLFMAAYPVCDFRSALQGIISTSVEEKIVDCPESVGAYMPDAVGGMISQGNLSCRVDISRREIWRF